MSVFWQRSKCAQRRLPPTGHPARSRGDHARAAGSDQAACGDAERRRCIPELRDEPLSPEVQARIGALPVSAAGSTHLGGALAEVGAHLESSPFKQRFTFSISDGQPDEEESARQGIARLETDGSAVLGLGLGSGTEMLRDLVPLSRTNLSAGELPQALTALFIQCLRAG